jgi:hypothetical protein
VFWSGGILGNESQAVERGRISREKGIIILGVQYTLLKKVKLLEEVSSARSFRFASERKFLPRRVSVLPRSRAIEIASASIICTVGSTTVIGVASTYLLATVGLPVSVVAGWTVPV